MRHGKKYRWMAALAGLLTAVTVFAFVLPSVAADEETQMAPSLYYDDNVWILDDQYPAISFMAGRVQDFWIPLSYISTFASIYVRRGSERNIVSFVISNTDTGQYLSFDVKSGTVQTERRTIVLMKTMYKNCERYLPMRDLCAYFGWTFEIAPDTNTLRITDGREKMTLDELLAPYRKEAETPVTEDTDDTDEEETTADTEPPETNEDYPAYSFCAGRVCLTFEDITEEYTADILDILDKYSVKAVFFVTGEQVQAMPETVVSILTRGHRLGLHTMSEEDASLTDTEAMLDSLETENALLYALTGQKVRLVRFPDGSHTSQFRLSDEKTDALSDAGYLVWDWNVDSCDLSENTDADGVLKKICTAFEKSYRPVVRFHCGALCAEVLDSLLEIICDDGTPMYCDLLSETEQPIYFH